MLVGSLFSGIGGLDLGFERAGFTIAWQVEIDPYCRRVLRKHWPAVPCYEDIREVGAHNLAPVDVLVGGFPCQDISNAGKRAGITGERSGLWSEYARLVRELRPRYVCVENVAALLHRGIDVVLGELAESGYDAEWQVLPAAAVGAPHLRERVFLVAYADYISGEQACAKPLALAGERDAWVGLAGRDWRRDERDPAQTVADADNGSKPGFHSAAQPAPGGRQRGDRSSSGGVADPASSGLAQRPRAPLYEPRAVERPERRGSRVFREPPNGSGAQWAIEPDVGRVANGVPARVERLRALGNAVVPQVAQYVAECIKSHAEGREELELCG